MNILACRNVDMSVYPPQLDGLAALLEPLGEGAQESTCVVCGVAVMLGPRQAITLDLDPDNHIVACFGCAARIPVMDSIHLGGKQ